jgi:ATP-dependent helicase YprA (DUF1998 family)
MYALLEGASEGLEISRDDIDATLSWSQRTRSIVLYDTVPAGAGAARKITENITTVLDEAYGRVDNCDCGIETSCFGCLRNSFNDRHHEVLKRADALRLLDQMCSYTAVTAADPRIMTCQLRDSPAINRAELLSLEGELTFIISTPSRRYIAPN